MQAEKAKSHLHSKALGSLTDWEGLIGTGPSRPFFPLETVSDISSRNLNLHWVEDSKILILSKLRDWSHSGDISCFQGFIYLLYLQ